LQYAYASPLPLRVGAAAAAHALVAGLDRLRLLPGRVVEIRLDGRRRSPQAAGDLSDRQALGLTVGPRERDSTATLNHSIRDCRTGTRRHPRDTTVAGWRSRRGATPTRSRLSRAAAACARCYERGSPSARRRNRTGSVKMRVSAAAAQVSRVGQAGVARVEKWHAATAEVQCCGLQRSVHGSGPWPRSGYRQGCGRRQGWGPGGRRFKSRLPDIRNSLQI
jgi:hypothetical protein